MAAQSDELNAAEISRLAGVTRATVSNWRRRHPDFPRPTGGTEASPTYDRRQVEAWLDARGRLPEQSAADELRDLLRGRSAAELQAVATFVAELAGVTRGERAELARLSGEELLAQGRVEVPTGSGKTESFLRAVSSAVKVAADEGGSAVLEVIGEVAGDPVGVRGTHTTPDGLAALMADLVTTGGARVRSVFDPACGNGRLLAAVAGRAEGAVEVYGQDIRAVQAAQARARVHERAHGARVEVATGDSLRSDAFPELRADAAVCNPPYGDREWGHDELALDPRWAYGAPPRAEPELAWVQHVLAHLADGGQAVLLLPPAMAARSSGRRIRAELVRQGALCAIAALPAGPAVPHHIGLHLWILRRPGATRSGGNRVLFVDASGDEQTSTDLDEAAETIRVAWTTFIVDPAGFAPVPGAAWAVPAIELLDESVDLTPTRHVRAAPALSPVDAVKESTESAERLAAAATSFAETAEPGPIAPAGETARAWRNATVADLARGHALTVHRGARGSGDTPPDLAERRVLRARDVIGGQPASGDATEIGSAEPVIIASGDVLLAHVPARGGAVARVADDDDAGCLLGHGVYLMRPDTDRLDPWFLAGFAAAPDNVSQATAGTSAPQLVPARLRIPLLPPDEQRAYGRAFRRLHDLRHAAHTAAQLADETARLLASGLTGGALLPPDNVST